MSLAALIRERRLVVCVGSGGVGKTTTAAALGVQAAKAGRKVLVLTIDPARRLANSLGIPRFGNEQVRVDLAGPLGVPPGGELWAMMLDNRRTADDLIARVAPTPERRDRILNNRIYRAIADNIAGSQDYMATEKLYDLSVSGDYDLVVLDTPPVKNALDFLEAPGRLARFLDRRIMRWFLTPYDEKRVFGRLMLGTSAVVFRLLGVIFGREFLAELSEFFFQFRDLYDGFRERHGAVERLFRDPGTAFLVVCSPEAPSVEVGGFFLRELAERGMPCPGVVINQRHRVRHAGADPEAELGALARARAADLAPHTAPRLLARLGAAHGRLAALAAAEDARVGRLLAELAPGQRAWSVPRLEGEVHDLRALDRLGRLLLAAEAERWPAAPPGERL